MSKVSRLSALLKGLGYALLCLVLLGYLLGYVEILWLTENVVEDPAYQAVHDRYGISGLVLLYLFENLDVIAGICAIWYLLKLAIAYQRGEVFSPRNARTLRGIGYSLIAGDVILDISNIALSSWLGADLYEFDLAFDYILLGLLVLVIGWIMEEAAEMKQFVDETI